LGKGEEGIVEEFEEEQGEFKVRAVSLKILLRRRKSMFLTLDSLAHALMNRTLKN